MGLGRINVHAGDFGAGLKSQYVHGKFHMQNKRAFFRETIASMQIELLELATEQSVVSIGGAVGWGLAGSVLLGPVGLLAGLVLGGRGKDVTFICKFKDGRKFLGTASVSTFNDLKKAAMSASF